MTLSTEIAAARPEEQREVLERLWRAWWQACGPCKMGTHAIFTAMLDCGAYLSAAEMLMPDGEREWSLERNIGRDERFPEYQARICIWLRKDDPEELSPQWIANATTPALALASAIAAAGEG